MARSHSKRVICVCPRCHPGRKVSLLIRQVHNRVNASKVENTSSHPVPLSDFDFDTGGFSDIDMEPVDDVSDGEGMSGSTGLITMLNFR